MVVRVELVQMCKRARRRAPVRWVSLILFSLCVVWRGVWMCVYCSNYIVFAMGLRKVCCVAVCYNVLQCVTVCCSALRCGLKHECVYVVYYVHRVCWSALLRIYYVVCVLQCIAAYILHIVYVAVHCCVYIMYCACCSA